MASLAGAPVLVLLPLLVVGSGASFRVPWKWEAACTGCTGTPGPCKTEGGVCAPFDDPFMETCPDRHIKCGSLVCGDRDDATHAAHRHFCWKGGGNATGVEARFKAANTAKDKAEILQSYFSQALPIRSGGSGAGTCNRCTSDALDCHPPGERLCRWGCTPVEQDKFHQACARAGGSRSATCMKHEDVPLRSRTTPPTYFEDLWTPRWRGLCVEQADGACPENSSPCDDFLVEKVNGDVERLRGGLSGFAKKQSNPDCGKDAHAWMKTWTCAAPYKNVRAAIPQFLCHRETAYESEQCGCPRSMSCFPCRVRSTDEAGVVKTTCIPQSVAECRRLQQKKQLLLNKTQQDANSELCGAEYDRSLAAAGGAAAKVTTAAPGGSSNSTGIIVAVIVIVIVAIGIGVFVMIRNKTSGGLSISAGGPKYEPVRPQNPRARCPWARPNRPRARASTLR